MRETLEEKLRKEDTAAELLNGHSVANLLKDFARHFSQQAVPATVQQAVAAGSGGGRGPLGMLQADDEAEQVCAGGGGERAYVWGGGSRERKNEGRDGGICLGDRVGGGGASEGRDMGDVGSGRRQKRWGSKCLPVLKCWPFSFCMSSVYF